MIKDIYLKVNARHISQLGRELVTDYVTALVELVKNSYDADAEGVKIIFNDILSGEGKIIIVDSGSGITQDDIENKWAVIGTNNKVRNCYSPIYKRKLAGKKGIGRFAVERLAEHCTIYSYPKEEKAFKYFINWNNFEGINIQEFKQRVEVLKNSNDISSAKYIKVLIEYLLANKNIDEKCKSEISDKLLFEGRPSYKLFLNNPLFINLVETVLLPVLENNVNEEKKVGDISTKLSDDQNTETDYYAELLASYYLENNINKKVKTGTVIVLDFLRDEWKEKDIQKVKNELLLLVAPIFIEKNSFNISLQAKEFKMEDIYLTNEILDLNFATVECILSDKGSKFSIIYEDKDSDKQIIPIEIEKKKCGDFSAKIYYFIRDSKLKSDSIKTNLAKNILDTFCGIKIYRDGFRVRPYGERGNDWLLLDNRKIKDTHGYLVGNNQVIGAINITEKDNPLMVDATNREAIIENEAFIEMKDLIVLCINKISEERKNKYLKDLDQKNIENYEKKEKIKDEKRIKDTEESLKRINEAIEKNNKEKALKYVKDFSLKVNAERIEKEKYYENTKNIFEEQLKYKESELNLYKNLASLGILAGTFGHETNGIISRINNDLVTAKGTMQFNDINSVYKIMDRMDNDIQRVQGYSTLIVSFLKKNKRDKLQNLNFKNVITNVIGYYENIIKSYSITVDLTDLSGFESEIPMLQIDLESIIINLFTNSFEALKGAENKSIKIATSQTQFFQNIIFEDSGHGIDKEKMEWIFVALNTTKKEDGVGLGLTIVKEIVERYKGTIKIDESKKEGARFIISFPRGEINE